MRCRYHVAVEMRPLPLPKRRFLLNHEITQDDHLREDFRCPVAGCLCVATVTKYQADMWRDDEQT